MTTTIRATRPRVHPLLHVAMRPAALIAFALGTAFTVPTIASAQDGHAAVNVDANAVALHGYDAVSYQTASAPAKGSPAFTAVHQGAIYQFSSAANRDTFAANPSKYAPAYGGYCAMGVAVGKKLDGDPLAYTVANGTLYLNVSPKVRTMWAKDIAGNETKAKQNWSAVQAHAGFDKM